MNTQESNLLIAEFMNLQIGEKMVLRNRSWTVPKYHKSWDWLMSVVEKIESLGFEVRIEGISCKINRVLEKDSPIVSWVCGDTKRKRKIKLVFRAIRTFIKWHNEQPK